jgi:hypothetical protein
LPGLRARAAEELMLRLTDSQPWKMGKLVQLAVAFAVFVIIFEAIYAGVRAARWCNGYFLSKHLDHAALRHIVLFPSRYLLVVNVS